MTVDPDDAQLYLLEAARLRELARQPEFAPVKAAICRVADWCETLAQDNRNGLAGTAQLSPDR